MPAKMTGRNKRPRMRFLHRAQGGLCAWCGRPVQEPDKAREAGAMGMPFSPSLDHVRPASMDGPNRLENLLLVHSKCNGQRGTRSLHARARAIHHMVLRAVHEYKKGVQ